MGLTQEEMNLFIKSLPKNEKVIKMNYEEWSEEFDPEGDGFNFSITNEIEEMEQIIKEKEDNTIWTTVPFFDGGVYIVNRFDPKGDMCFFSNKKYETGLEYEVCYLEPNEYKEDEEKD